MMFACSYDAQLLPEARDSFHRLLRSLSIAARLWRTRYSSVCVTCCVVPRSVAL
jgi:hypothetical protein